MFYKVGSKFRKAADRKTEVCLGLVPGKARALSVEANYEALDQNVLVWRRENITTGSGHSTTLSVL